MSPMARCGQCGLKAEKGLEQNKDVVSALEGDVTLMERQQENHIFMCVHRCAHTHTHTHPDQQSQLECSTTQPLTSDFPAEAGMGLSREVHQARKSSCRRYPVPGFLLCHHGPSSPDRCKLGEASWL